MEAIKTPLHAIAWMLAALMAIQVFTLIEAKTTRPPKQQLTQYEYVVDEYDHGGEGVREDSRLGKWCNSIHRNEMFSYQEACQRRYRISEANKKDLMREISTEEARALPRLKLPPRPRRPKETSHLETWIAVRVSEGYELLNTEIASSRKDLDRKVVLLFFRRPKGYIPPAPIVFPPADFNAEHYPDIFEALSQQHGIITKPLANPLAEIDWAARN